MVLKETNQAKWTKDGRCWYYRCYYTDIYGNRKQKQSKMFKTKKEAISGEIDFLSKNVNGEKDIKNMMFNDLYEEWWNIKKDTVKMSTSYSLKKTLEKHILIFFKNYKLEKINNTVIDNYYKYLESTNLYTCSKNRIVIYLKEIFNYAKDVYNFDYRVIKRIHLIKDEKITINRDVDWNYWTLEEFNKFISYVDDELYKVLFTFLYYTGLRIGELNALTWNDINLNNKTVSVTKTLSNKLGIGTYKITNPKTTNSIRTIKIDDNLVNMLKEHKEREEKIINFNNEMFVFGNVKYVSPTTIRNHLNKYISKDESLKRITPHGFRHSHVSLLINLGLNVREVADRIGDTSMMIEKVYYHMFPEKVDNIANIINNLNENKR